MPSDNMTDALRWAAERCDSHRKAGFQMEWVVKPYGLELRVWIIASRLNRVLPWAELSQVETRDAILKKYEDAAVAALGS